jgi:autoinducer 2-degrading protein
MSKLAVIGTVVVRPGTRNEVLRAALAHRERCLKDESGTLAFEVLVPEDDATKLLFYELYADPASFAAHSNGKSMAQLQSEVDSKITSLTVIQCTPGTEALA